MNRMQLQWCEHHYQRYEYTRNVLVRENFGVPARFAFIIGYFRILAHLYFRILAYFATFAY